MKRLVFAAGFLELGLVLVVIPWSMYWDRNYFAQVLPAVHQLITNNFVRGAVSGLGVINVAFGIAELVSLIASRQTRPTSIAPSQYAQD